MPNLKQVSQVAAHVVPGEAEKHALSSNSCAHCSAEPRSCSLPCPSIPCSQHPVTVLRHRSGQAVPRPANGSPGTVKWPGPSGLASSLSGPQAALHEQHVAGLKSLCVSPETQPDSYILLLMHNQQVLSAHSARDAQTNKHNQPAVTEVEEGRIRPRSLKQRATCCKYSGTNKVNSRANRCRSERM